MFILKKYVSKIKKIKESSLSRIVQHIQEHDTGTITAYRSEYTKKENQQRNRSLFSKLASLNYSIISIKGYYIENYNTSNAVKVKEISFFVVDKKDRKNLRKDLKNLGEEFKQDSILFVPKKGEVSYLIGTSKKRDSYPGYGIEKKFPILELGKENCRFLTRVNGRPFYFTEKIIDEFMCSGVLGLYGMSFLAKKHWKNIKIN